MPQTSPFIDRRFDRRLQREQEKVEAMSPVEQFTQSPDTVRWDVELAREWAVLGGD